MAQDDSILQLIRNAKAKSRSGIEEEVWEALPFKTREQLGRSQLHRIIAAEKNDPEQYEFVVDGEPFPLDEVNEIDLPRLREAGYRLIKAGKSSIRRGEAYLAEYNRRMVDKKHGG